MSLLRTILLGRFLRTSNAQSAERKSIITAPWCLRHTHRNIRIGASVDGEELHSRHGQDDKKLLKI